MNCKFGAIIVDAKGKLGGHVVSHNKYGAFMSTKKMSKANASASQFDARSRFAAVLKSFRNLTFDQMTAWGAAAPQYARANYFGEQKIPTALALYTRLNLQLLTIGEDMITDPPMFAAPGEMELISFVTTSTPSMILTYSPAVPVGVKAVIMATPPFSPGKVATSKMYSIISVIGNGAPNLSPLNITTAYTTKYGSVGAIGQRIHIAVSLVDINTGICGLARTAADIVSVP